MINKLETERLIITTISLDDAKEMYEYARRYDFGPKADWPPHPNLEHTKDVIKELVKEDKRGVSANFTIRRKEDNKMLGTIELFKIKPGFKAEIGFSIRPEEQCKGYCSEAIKKITDFGFYRFGLVRIEALSFVNNYASHKACENAGFKFEGILKNNYITYNNKIVDIYMMAICKENEDEN